MNSQEKKFAAIQQKKLQVGPVIDSHPTIFDKSREARGINPQQRYAVKPSTDAAKNDSPV